ncbi:MAG: hypothetical protein RIR49_483 [Actinomycetota bacterium]
MSGHVPHEFSSVSVSAYESATLSALLQERSADGWSVISILPAGTSVVAYLSRPIGGNATATTPSATTASSTAVSSAVTPEPVTPTPATTGAGWALQPESASDSASSASTSTAAVTPTAATSTAAASTASAASAPAGWYADPSGRFELRYWDGGRWTEHVSRGGNQYTDPPVA